MLTSDVVKKVAKLSRIDLSDSEIGKFTELLSKALEYVDVLDELDTSKVEPTSQVTGKVNCLENDFYRESLAQEEAIKNAPRKERGYIVTGLVVKK